jgi:ribosomal protein L31E
MAEKKADKVADERLFTIPLRREWLKVPMNRRAKRSAAAIRAHLSRHMKVPERNIRISAGINDTLWARGAGKPPARIRLKASLDASGILHAGLPDEKPPEAEKKKGEEPAKEERAKPEEPVKEEAGPAGKPGPANEEKTKESAKTAEAGKHGKPASRKE